MYAGGAVFSAALVECAVTNPTVYAPTATQANAKQDFGDSGPRCFIFMTISSAL